MWKEGGSGPSEAARAGGHGRLALFALDPGVVDRAVEEQCPPAVELDLGVRIDPLPLAAPCRQHFPRDRVLDPLVGDVEAEERHLQCHPGSVVARADLLAPAADRIQRRVLDDAGRAAETLAQRGQRRPAAAEQVARADLGADDQVAGALPGCAMSAGRASGSGCRPPARPDRAPRACPPACASGRMRRRRNTGRRRRASSPAVPAPPWRTDRRRRSRRGRRSPRSGRPRRSSG